jgi:hypothetical protein
MARTAYERRVALLLADEDYGPALARLNRADTAEVLKLVQANEGQRARLEILRLDARRRAAVTTSRQRRRSTGVVEHVIAELSGAGLDFSVQTVQYGVKLMTRGEVVETLGMDASEIQEAAGDSGNVRWYEEVERDWNVWFYH